jgi:hypothetical protein
LSGKRRAEEDEDDEAGGGQDRLGEAIGEGILFVIGLYMIYVSNWNWLLIGIGTVLAGSPVLQIPAIRIAINNKTGHQIFKVQQSHISGSNVVGSAREVHFHQAPQTVIQPPTAVPQAPQAQPQTTEPSWEVDEEFTLKPEEDEDWRDFEFDLEDGEELIGSIETDGGDVNCYVLGRASFRSFRDDEDFNPYWAKQAVTKTMVSFLAPGSRKYFFVVVSDEEDEDVSVTVRLSVKS